MKQIKSFEFTPGFEVNTDDVDTKVNSFISSLTKRGIEEVDLKISSSNRSIIFTVILEETENMHY